MPLRVARKTQKPAPAAKSERAPAAAGSPPAGPCPHKGDKIGGLRGVGCGGKAFTLPVFACGLFGTCTERPATGETFVELAATHRACQGCRRQPPVG